MKGARRPDEPRAARCVLSLATSDRNYPELLVRLGRSVVESGFAGEFHAWPPGRFPDGCPPHLEVPFAFKPFCFREARDRGFEALLWLDSSCVVVRPLDQLFRQIEERGHLLVRQGRFAVGAWASDAALEWFGLSRDEAMAVPEVNAAAIGLDLRHPLAREFLDRWHEAALAGVPFRGSQRPFRARREYDAVTRNEGGAASSDPRVSGHRHDQTAAGILAHRLGLELSSGALQYYGRNRPPIRPDAVVVHDRANRYGGMPFAAPVRALARRAVRRARG